MSKLSPPVKKNESYILEITDLSNEGAGIGKIEGFSIFVESALPGETVEILIVKLHKSYAYGKLLKIIKQSHSRVTPRCAYSRCGGCNLQHLEYSAQLNYKTHKVRNALERIGKLDNVNVLPTIPNPNMYFYRNKAQFPVGCNSDSAEIGFYAKRSHLIIPIKNCLIQSKACNDILPVVNKFIQTVSVYDELSHTGLLRHIIIRTSETTSEIMLIFVLNGYKFPNSVNIDIFTALPNIASIYISPNTRKTNVILGDSAFKVWGRDFIVEQLGALSFRISPLSFFQVNTVQAKILYDKVLEFAELSGSETVIDLYCGTGTISLYIAQKCKKVIGVEIIPQAIETARQNAVENNIINAEFFCGEADVLLSEILASNCTPDLIILDPPRSGCHKNVIDAIINYLPTKIIYVSCDPATLARDLNSLSEFYCVKLAQPLDLFSQTVHVETVALIERK